MRDGKRLKSGCRGTDFVYIIARNLLRALTNSYRGRRNQMPLKIIGAGFGRTGTLSLKAALERLGFGPCYHMLEVMSRPAHVRLWHRRVFGEPIDWDELFTDFNATVDWPACSYWRELTARDPGAKVLLSVRPP
jgi:hypothetical protein